MLTELLATAALSLPWNGGCERPAGTVPLTFSAAKYPNIHRHYLDAVAKGWTTRLVLTRGGADARRAKAMREYGLPTKPGFDRDEYPPAVGRGRGPGLSGGSNPRGWKTDLAYVPMSENRSHGASMGAQLRRYCNGVAFKYTFS